MPKVKCVECGRDPFYLSDLGADPCLCGYCKGWMCPTHNEHKACSPKIDKHNKEVEKRKIKKEISRLRQKLKDMG